MLSLLRSWWRGAPEISAQEVRRLEGGTAAQERGVFQVMPAEQLLRETGMDGKVESIRTLTGFHADAFNQLCLTAIHAFADAVQLMPASQAHHHAGPGGMLVHAMEVIEFALRRRKGCLLPQGAQAEDILRLEHLWTYAMFVAALMHDIGKPIADQRITLFLPDGTTRPWTPLAESMLRQGASRYKVEFVHEDKNYDLHSQVSMLMYPLIIPTIGRDWLAQDRKLMAQLSAWLYGDTYKAGVIGDIVSHADGDSVAANLGTGDRSRLATAKDVPLVERLLRSLRNQLVTGKLPLNRDGAAGWVYEGHIWLLVPRVPDAVREDMVGQGHSGIPANNERFFDIWQEHNCLIPTANGKAVWTVNVEGDGYRHRFTAMKFPLSVLFKPREYPKDMKGKIVVAADKSQELPPAQAARAPAAHSLKQPAEAAGETPVTVATNKPSSGSELEQFSNMGEGSGGSTVVEAPADPGEAAIPAPSIEHAGGTDILAQLDALCGVADVAELEPFSPPPQAQEAIVLRMEVEPASERDTGYYDTVPNVSEKAASAETASHAIAPISVKRDTPPSANVIGKTKSKPVPSEEALNFMKWVQAGLSSGTMSYNESGAMVHFAPEGMLLVSPKVFQTYAGKNTEDWMGIQKRFVKSGWALKAPDGRFIWRYQVISGKNATGILLNCMIVASPGEFINEVPAVNPFLVLFDGALVGD